MIVAASFCPHPPVLVPLVAATAAVELETLLADCDRAVLALRDSGAHRIVVLGSGEADETYPPGAVGSFAGFGVPLQVTLGAAAANQVSAPLPLSLTVGAWLLSRAGLDHVECYGLSVTPGSAVPDARTDELLGTAERCALLVMGDGSARRGTAAPGYLDDRAAAVDAGLARALSSGDARALAGIDQELAAQLLIAGAPAWRAAGELLQEGRWDATLDFDDAPYGVGYFVARWRRV